MDPIRVLIVEDDEHYREIVGDELSWHGFAVRSFADGDSLLGSLDAAAEADVIVLDWRLPNISGIDLLPELRRRGVNLPAVFLTSHAQPANEKLAFERGALDFIDKMRGVEFLAKRLRLASELGKPVANTKADKPTVCGKLVLSSAVHRAYWKKVDVGLTVSEYGIVQLLASNVGRYLTYRVIHDVQYYEGFVAGQLDQGYRTNVRSSIKRIRHKFCEVDSTFSEIQNSSTRGYRWRGLTARQPAWWRNAMPDDSAPDAGPLPAALLQMMTGYWVSQALYVAAKLGVADLLVDGPQSVEHLAVATQTARRARSGAYCGRLRAWASSPKRAPAPTH